MALQLKNTYTKRVEDFTPLDPSGAVTLYSCGPTVYSHNHIGNFRSFLLADVLRRVLEQRGHSVRHVMNITDVGHMTEDHIADAAGEDKLSKAGRQLGLHPYEVAARFQRSFEEDAKALKLKNYADRDAQDATLHPRATQHIPEMLDMIQRLIEREYAYIDSVGQVYFSVASFPAYGQLSGKVLGELEAGARISVREEKRDPRDFALWKVDPKHLMQWDPHSAEGWPDGEYARLRALVPGGVSKSIARGFPGWHIECSAMSRASLGPVIDIHTGGEDNVFPHHECEIAQSYGARQTADAPLNFSRYWVHARHLLVNGTKMSKREGSLITVKALLDPAHAGPNRLTPELVCAGFPHGQVSAAVLRFALISTPFTQPMNFTVDSLVQAQANVSRWQSLYDRLQHVGGTDVAAHEIRDLVASALQQFDAALDDNLNMSRALAAVFHVISNANQRGLSAGDALLLRQFLEHADEIFAVLDPPLLSGQLSNTELKQLAEDPAFDATLGEADDARTVGQLLAARWAARSARDYARADQIRRHLAAHGVELDDTRDGVRWRKI